MLFIQFHKTNFNFWTKLYIWDFYKSQCLGFLLGTAPHMVSFENFVKSMPPSLSELKVTPRFCFPIKIRDDRTTTYLWYLLKITTLLVYLAPESMCDLKKRGATNWLNQQGTPWKSVTWNATEKYREKNKEPIPLIIQKRQKLKSLDREIKLTVKIITHLVLKIPNTITMGELFMCCTNFR